MHCILWFCHYTFGWLRTDLDQKYVQRRPRPFQIGLGTHKNRHDETTSVRRVLHCDPRGTGLMEDCFVAPQVWRPTLHFQLRGRSLTEDLTPSAGGTNSPSAFVLQALCGVTVHEVSLMWLRNFFFLFLSQGNQRVLRLICYCWFFTRLQPNGSV